MNTVEIADLLSCRDTSSMSRYFLSAGIFLRLLALSSSTARCIFVASSWAIVWHSASVRLLPFFLLFVSLCSNFSASFNWSFLWASIACLWFASTTLLAFFRSRLRSFCFFAFFGLSLASISAISRANCSLVFASSSSGSAVFFSLFLATSLLAAWLLQRDTYLVHCHSLES